MVDVPLLGRKRSLAVSTFATAVGCAAFAVSRSAFTIRVTSMFISLAATTMWAVLYVRYPVLALSTTLMERLGLDTGDIRHRSARDCLWYCFWYVSALRFQRKSDTNGHHQLCHECLYLLVKKRRSFSLTLLNRGGMFAPLIGGFLLSIDRALPVYAAVGVFALAGACTLLIDEPENQEKSDSGPSFVH